MDNHARERPAWLGNPTEPDRRAFSPRLEIGDDVPGDLPPRSDGKSTPGSPWRSYKERLARVAQRLVDVQRSIRILNAIKWDPSVFERFRDSRWRNLPRVDADYYASQPLGFDSDATVEELRAIDKQVRNDLGDDLVGRIVSETALQFVDAVEMLKSRGTKRFYEISRRLYGSPKETLADGATLLRDVALDAAGSHYIKLRRGAMFSDRDLKLLEVHEGWVHVATSLNGQRQAVARWLAIGAPRRAAGPLNARVLAVDKAEDGASFLDVFEWFRTEGYDEETCFWSTHRVFRGGVLDGGAPFTKDIVYTKGIVSSYNFLRSAIAAGRPELIAWLFVGKTDFEDLPVLVARAHEGVVH